MLATRRSFLAAIAAGFLAIGARFIPGLRETSVKFTQSRFLYGPARIREFLIVPNDPDLVGTVWMVRDSGEFLGKWGIHGRCYFRWASCPGGEIIVPKWGFIEIKTSAFPNAETSMVYTRS